MKQTLIFTLLLAHQTLSSSLNSWFIRSLLASHNAFIFLMLYSEFSLHSSKHFLLDFFLFKSFLFLQPYPKADHARVVKEYSRSSADQVRSSNLSVLRKIQK